MDSPSSTTSNFTNSTASTTPDIRKHIYNVVTTTATINAQNNYWFNAIVPTSTNASGVNTSSPRSTPIDSTVCPQDPPVPIPAQELTLADYGIVTSGAWTQTELDAILAGVTRTGEALQSQYGGSSPADAFNRVMYFPDRSEILLVRSTDQGFGCITDNAVSPPIQSQITCLTGVIVTEYTIVHELGHVLVGRTGGYSAQDPNANNNPSYYRLSERGTILDGVPEIVYGYYFDAVNQIDQWERGNRGWGSSSTLYSAQQACDFQQNPLVQPGLTPAEVDEGAADMFLNWVYRKANAGGFQNVDWRSYTTCSLMGPADQWSTGDRRYNWMDGIMTTLGNDRGW